MTKLAVSKVSKRWRTISLEYLFESLLFNMDDDTPDFGLHPIVSESLDHGAAGHLRYVKHLRARSSSLLSWPGASFAILMTILEGCCNLAIFQYTVSHSYSRKSPPLFHTLFDTCNTSLRRLELSFNAILPANFFVILEKAWLLEHLQIQLLSYPVFTVNSVYLPSLRILIIDNHLENGFNHPNDISFITWNVPRLTHLRYCADHGADNLTVDALRMFPMGLEVLHLPDVTPQLFQATLESFPCLKSLRVRSFLHGAAFWNLEGSFPSIRRIDVAWVMCRDYQEQLDFFLAMFTSFCNRHTFPSLESTGIISPSLFYEERRLTSSPRWAEQIDQMRGLGIRVEVGFGDLQWGTLGDQQWHVFAWSGADEDGQVLDPSVYQHLSMSNRLDIALWSDRFDRPDLSMFAPPMAHLVL